MSDGPKNLFISHVHEDDKLLGQLKALLERNGYDVRDGSIDSSKPNDASNPDYIKYQILAPRISWAGTFVVLVSPRTHESQWVEWEIEHAHREGKRIVGIWAPDAKDADLPKGLEAYADAMVGWQADSLMAAVDGRDGRWLEPNGAERARRDIDRYKC